ncbi:MAG: hypothetical protein QXV05_04210 [Candidatus Korarchaeum sp.]
MYGGAKFIRSVGVELEGGIRESAISYLRSEFGPRVVVGYDGSVKVPGDSEDWRYDAEIRFWSESLDELLRFVRSAFDLGLTQNASCGNHHHFVFGYHSLIVSAMATPRLYRDFMREYGKFMKGLPDELRPKYERRIDNRYCAFPSKENMRYAILGLERYYSVNFAAMYKHGTLEVRLPPHVEDYDEFARVHLWLVKTMDSLAGKYLRGARMHSTYALTVDE